MNEQAIYHMPDSAYCYAQSGSRLVLRLRMDRRDEVDRVEILLECKYRFQEQQDCFPMERKYEDRLFAYYESEIELSDVRTAYVFRIWQGEDAWYFSEDGLTKEYDFSFGYFNFFQLPYLNEADLHREVPWMRQAVFYQIFVDRFYRGIKEKDERYINLPWGGKPLPKSFAGGDIPGVTQKLDYIKELGVNTLYLTPVFQSISNHKYDISDYYTIDEQFGKNEDLKELVEQAHRRGMRIVLDAVFNHCSDRMRQFQDVLKKGRASAYHDWFLIRGDKPDQDTVNYEVFSFCNYMPKLNTSNLEVQKFLTDIAVYWIKEYEIDGWRLDVSDEVSHDFWRLFRKRVKEAKEDCVIIGENWHDANSFLRGDQYDSIMNYAFTKACLDYYAFDAFDAQQFAWRLNGLLMRNTGTVNRMMLNLLDTHDTDRFYTSVGKNKNRLLSALAVTCMFEGAPCVYYGTEIPTEGGYDPDNRRCFDWDENHWDRDVRAQLKELLSLRRQPVIQGGEIRITSENGLFCLRRFLAEAPYRGSGGAESAGAGHAAERTETAGVTAGAALAAEEWTLWTNQTGAALPVRADGVIFTQNRYRDGVLETDGYVIIKKDDREEAKNRKGV
ncbi:MAG: glycoside hydrolase family 13 protein [Clostridium sp.]|nr:glycoside hydrolase family 13 protein [Clostridium sp.]